MGELLTLDEVSEQMRVPVATLRYWRHNGTGPRSFRLGGKVVYKRTDVEQWVEAQYEAGTSHDPQPAA